MKYNLHEFFTTGKTSGQVAARPTLEKVAHTGVNINELMTIRTANRGCRFAQTIVNQMSDAVVRRV